MNNSNKLKFIFIFVVIGVMLISRFWYPGLTSGNTSASEELSVNASSAETPILVLPTITTTSPQPEPTPATDTLNYVIGDSTLFFTKSGSTTPPKLSDAALLVSDLQNDTTMLALHPNARWPMASLTKLMTAVIVMDTMQMGQTLPVTKEMFAADPQEFTLQIGGTYSVSDLLRVLLLPSSNVAAETFAQNYGRDKFLSLMNAKAASWGMSNTFYDDPSGISSANQSTAHDLLLLAQHIYNDYPQIYAITRVPHVTILNATTQQSVAVNSIDNFASSASFIGGKTGHTDEASGNLLTVFNYKNHPLFIVVLGTSDRFGDSTKLFNWVKLNYQ